MTVTWNFESSWTSLKKCDNAEDKRIQEECNDKTLEESWLILFPFIPFLSLQGLELSTEAIK